MSGQHPQYLKQWVLSPPAETLSIRLPRQDEEEPAVGKGFEVELGKFWFNQETNKWVRWHERYLVVYSQSLAASAIRGQQQRLLTARTALDKLANKPGDDREELSHKVENIRDFHKINYSTNNNDNHFKGGVKGLPSAAPSPPFCSNLNNDACFSVW